MALGRPNLGSLLISNGIITEAQLQFALLQQGSTGLRLGETLVALEMCTEAQITRALAAQLDIPFIDLQHTAPSPAVQDLLPRETALEYGILPISLSGDRLLAAVRDPYDIRLDSIVRQATGKALQIGLATETQLREALSGYSTLSAEAAAAIDPQPLEIRVHEIHPEGAVAVEQLVAAGKQASTIRVVNTLIAEAAHRRASAIHLAPSASGVHVRYKVDGELYPVVTLEREQLPSIVARIKLLCKMDVMESRKPQEGHCRLLVNDEHVQLRASTVPEVNGELLTIRLFVQGARQVDFETLGMDPRLLDQVKRVLCKRQGLLLATGPAGSGKTTTLHAALGSLASTHLNVITVEDPVEVQLPGVSQVQVEERLGQSFSATLRAVLRQDPDVVMVGEIRDPETAGIACRAALTGRLVLSTLHTNHALGTIARLQDMGVPSYVLAASLSGIVAQRLARKVCEECAEEHEPTPAIRRFLYSQDEDLSGIRFRRGRGCSACHQTGLAGRVGIYEFLPMTEGLRRLLFQGASGKELMEYLRQAKFRSMQQDAFQKACDGIISPEEAVRVGMSLCVDDFSDVIDTRALTEELRTARAAPAGDLTAHEARFGAAW
jgi:type II secretory ATPase GspE/PulE/Tfp pilus assembly ATPase PilB-like protein